MWPFAEKDWKKLLEIGQSAAKLLLFFFFSFFSFFRRKKKEKMEKVQRL